ncbi:unnamed protein product [Allacma fusca]|uniref:Uncharacterized protein n=1 Tax=Allacma fusca TaxID=39272 RepID=A0A8J2NG50_9HEXA|nr:unnamed protein product [Allacma fusca]
MVIIGMLDMLVAEVLAKQFPKGSSTTKEPAEEGKEEHEASSELEEQEDIFFSWSPLRTRYEVDPFKAWDLDLPILINEEKEGK